MSKAYWLYNNRCPWCGELYKEVNHDAGCPKPDPNYLPERQKSLRLFVDSLTNRYLKEKIKN